MSSNQMDWSYFDRETRTFAEVLHADRRRILAQVVVPNQPISRYFVVAPGDLWLPTGELLATRARPEGIVSSSQRMAEAKAGTRPPRKALSIQFDIGLGCHLVIDGNSTLFCCRLAGFHAVLCRR